MKLRGCQKRWWVGKCRVSESECIILQEIVWTILSPVIIKDR